VQLKIGSILLFFCFLFTQQIQVKALVDRNSIQIDENLEYTIEISGLRDFPNFRLPGIADFEILNLNPSTSQSVQIINGTMQQKISYTFILKPKKEGQLTIPSFNLDFKGQKFATGELKINVSKALPENTSQDVFIKFSLNTSEPLINQEVTVKTLLYVKTNVRINEVRISKVPSLSGFWKETYELNGIKNIGQESVNGITYTIYLLTQEALYPTLSGKQTIESAEVVANIIKQKAKSRSNDPFADFFGQSQQLVQVTVPSVKKTVTVRDVDASAFKNYSKFVGNLKMNVSLDKTSVNTNEGIKLTISLLGNGNMSTIKEPSFFISPDIEQYEPNVKTTIKRDATPISGKKVIEYVLVPRVAGEQEIGPFEISYYNTEKKKIEAISSPAYKLTVGEGKSFANAEGRNSLSQTKKNVKQLEQDIRYIRIESETFSKSDSYLFRNFIFILSFPLIILIYFILNWFMGKMRLLDSNESLKRQKEASSKANKILKQAKEFYTKKEANAFFVAIYKGIAEYIADKTGTDATGFTLDVLETLLKKKNIELALINDIKSILEICDFYRYSNPSDPNAEMDKILNNATQTLNKLTKVL
jgi:hypothetical protein